VSHPHYEEQMATVEGLLKELGLDHTPMLIVFNKQDKVSPQLTQNLCRLYEAVALEARNPASLRPLIEHMQTILWGQFPSPKRYHVDEGEPTAAVVLEGVQ
jgi:GTP-binding protein HflX